MYNLNLKLNMNMNTNMTTNMSMNTSINMNTNIDTCLIKLRPSLELFETRIIRNLLDNISEDYGLNKDDLYKKYLKIDCDNNSNTDNSNENTICYSEGKCNALTKEYTQCSRNQFRDTKFCQSHGKILDKNKTLPQGTIFKRVENKPKVIEIIHNLSENKEVVLEKITNNNNDDNNDLFVNVDTQELYEKDKDNDTVKQVSRPFEEE